MNKYIFLDIDGVLNNHRCGQLDFDKECIDALNSIGIPDIKVIISSTWRKSHTLDELKVTLSEEGLKLNIMGVTPILKRPCLRGNEIYQWLEEHAEKPYTYVILDDDSDMLYWQKDNFIHVDGQVGITLRNIHRAEYILCGSTVIGGL